MKKGKILLLALGHGLNDCIAGFFLGSLALVEMKPLQIGMAVTVYNLLAFGGQYPVALWLEKSSSPKKFLLTACSLNACAVIIFYFSVPSAILFAGIASAIYHVAGGAACVQKNKATNIGVFASPGVLGLIGGGLLAWSHVNILWMLLLMSILFLFLVSRLRFNVKPGAEKAVSGKPLQPVPEKHDLIMILLLMVISLRSVVWNIFQLIHENDFTWLIAIAASAFAGKLAGGWIADRMGWRIYAIASAVISMPLLTFFKKEIVLFCIGIGVLQSGIPATTSLLIQNLDGKAARGIGLSFGTAIILGATGSLFPQQILLQQLPVILTAIVLILLFYLYQKPGKMHRLV
jgi:FSR family fosmidomycin resistance protein-like MFS transporter